MTSSPNIDNSTGFGGLTVAAFESRMADQMASLITRHGGIPAVAPSMQEIPLENNVEALALGEQLLSNKIDILVLMTGVGTKTLVDVWQTRFPLEDMKHALSQTTLVARGPKPLAALKDLGLKADLTVPEPNTWEDVLNELDVFKPDGLSGLTIGIQEYGARNYDLLHALERRGANVICVPVYRWALPDDVAPLRQVIQQILSHSIDVALFTSGAQVTHLVELLTQSHDVERFTEAMSRMVVGSIGSMTSQQLRAHHFPVDLEPSHPKMGILVKETSIQAQQILRRKRQTSS